MECKNCNKPLIKGRLTSNGIVWLDFEKNSLLKTIFFFGGAGGKKPMIGEFVYAYKCPQCNEITLRANS